MALKQTRAPLHILFLCMVYARICFVHKCDSPFSRSEDGGAFDGVGLLYQKTKGVYAKEFALICFQKTVNSESKQL